MSSVKVHVILSSSQVYGWLGFFLSLASSAYHSSHSRDSRKTTVEIPDYISDYTDSWFCQVGLILIRDSLIFALLVSFRNLQSLKAQRCSCNVARLYSFVLNIQFICKAV